MFREYRRKREKDVAGAERCLLDRDMALVARLGGARFWC